jgi:hypothetical protein
MIAKNTLSTKGGQINSPAKFNRVPEELFDFAISDGAFKLYVLMLSYGWFKPECWTAKEELARRMHRSTRQISRLLRELEEVELIAIQPPTATRATNTYCLKLWTPPQPEQSPGLTKPAELRKTTRNYGGCVDGTINKPTTTKAGVKDKTVTPTETNPAKISETNLSHELKDSELHENNYTKNRVCDAITENTGKAGEIPLDTIAQILIEAGVSRLKAAEVAELAQKNGRSVADVTALIRSVRKNSRIANTPAYILRMIELDLFPSSTNLAPGVPRLNKPFVASLKPVVLEEPVDLDCLWEKVCKAVAGKFNKPDLAAKISRMSVSRLEDKTLSITPQEAWQKRTISQADLALLEMVLRQESGHSLTKAVFGS